MASQPCAAKAEAASIGLGRTGLRGTWATDLPFEDDIEANALVLRHGQGPPVPVMNCDMLSMLPATCLRISDRVARTLGATPEQVGVFSTQNHCISGDYADADVFDHDRLAERFAQAADLALRAAEPAQMAYVEAAPHPGGLLNGGRDSMTWGASLSGSVMRNDRRTGWLREAAATSLEGVDGRTG